MSVEKRKAFPIKITQIIKEKSTKKVKESSGSKSKLSKGATEKKRVGRPKGSKTKNKATVELKKELLMLKDMLNELRQMIGNYLPVKYQFRSKVANE